MNALSSHIIVDDAILDLVQSIREPLAIIKTKEGDLNVIRYKHAIHTLHQEKKIVGILPPLYPEWLGDPSFLSTHGTRFPYIVGEMANGIATAEMVIAAVKAGMIGFFGAAGLMPDVVQKNIHAIQSAVHDAKNWGSNLIHSPQEPQLEAAIVGLYLCEGVQRVSASAYMTLSPHIVHYACKGLFVNSTGDICRRHYVFAKISRAEVAKQFMSPPPAAILAHLVETGKLTQEEARFATNIPVAQDITVEADSGGHTDNRPLTALFPTIQLLAQQLTEEYRYPFSLRIGAAGGLGTPSAIASAFALGAAYVLTGSINQSALESGLSSEGRVLLSQADMADVMMAPAADMFELGVKLQVLKRGTLFGVRASKLYEYYTQYDSLEAIPESEKNKLEKQVLSATLDEVWQSTCSFFEKRDPEQLHRAEKNPKYRMALVFRWYLGLSSHWAITGEKNRKMDYQIWCGPAMGAFNRWVSNSFLADINQRTVGQIGLNLLEGAASIMRAQQLRNCGVTLPMAAFNFHPRYLS